MMSLSCNRLLRSGVLPAVVLLLLVAAVPVRAGNAWFKITAGWNGMAMDDVNDGVYRFYETTIDGYGLPDFNSGFGLGFHVGSDLGPKLGLGFSWERQHAHAKGTDIDVTADLKLDADIFMGHVYWRPVHAGRFSAGLAGGVGFAAANGAVDISAADGANYGELDTSGGTLAWEGELVAEYAFARNKGLQLTAGYRHAKITRVEVGGIRATMDDGSDLALDYSGVTLRLGIIWRFGDGGTGGTTPVDIN